MPSKIIQLSSIFICFLIAINAHGQVKDPLFTYKDVASTALTFNNEIPDSLALYVFKYEYAYNGGGVALGDVNNDGLCDVYFSSTFGKNKLYLNLGNMKFKDMSEEIDLSGGAGLKTGVNMIDVNDDGLLDIYVCKSGHYADPRYRQNVLYINKGNLKFQEEGYMYGIGDVSYSTQSYFADFDHDGDLDMFLLNHPLGWDKKHSLQATYDAQGKLVPVKDTTRQYVSNRLYINEGKKFVDRTYQFKVDNIAFGLSAVLLDVNEDGYTDVYVANDYSAPDFLYINQQGKYFEERAQSYFDNIPNNSMGSDALDANNDGKLDLFVLDMMPDTDRRLKTTKSLIKNYDSHLLAKKLGYHDQFRYNAFQIAQPDQSFSNQAFYSGTSNTDWSWTVLGEDYDQDGKVDLFITNGYLKDVMDMDYTKYRLDSLIKNTPKSKFVEAWSKAVSEVKLTNYFFQNKGEMQYENVSKIWCDGRPSFSNGAAYGDLDNDGDLDIVVNNINEPAFLLQNNLEKINKKKSTTISLVGGKGNRYGIGSTILIAYKNGTVQKKLYQPSRGFLSSCDYNIIVPYDDANPIDHIAVDWYDGTQQVFKGNFPIKHILTKNTASTQASAPARLQDAANQIVSIEKFDYVHKENEYIDFKREPLLHLQHSAEGPSVLAHDINSDGSIDLIVGGASGQSTAVYVTNENNNLIKKEDAALEADRRFEDSDMTILDIDNDGDQDLIITSGGYQWPQGDTMYRVRCYINLGSGTFKIDSNFPALYTNASSICNGDWDGDGDLDIFIGGGAWPGQYPRGDRSYYLENVSGRYTLNPGATLLFSDIMIKDAIAKDLNHDGKLELIIAGDYQPIQIYGHDGASFYLKQSIPNSNGMWQKLFIIDVNQDGVEDIVAGNLGLNSFMKANKDKPACIYYGDFDSNGEYDGIQCIDRGEGNLPIHSLDKLLTQFTSLRKKFLRYHQYANKSVEDIFGKNKVDLGKKYIIYTFASSILLSSGEQYVMSPLPAISQMSMLKDMVNVKLGGEDYIFGVGNFHNTDFDYGKYDASRGFILKIDKASGTLVPIYNSGFMARDNMRSIAKISPHQLVMLANNGEAQLCKIKK